jgi:hypothetical protein
MPKAEAEDLCPCQVNAIDAMIRQPRPWASERSRDLRRIIGPDP